MERQIRRNRSGLLNIKPDGTNSAFKSTWQRWEKKLGRPFTERSLRNLVGSEVESLEDAKHTLGHTIAQPRQSGFTG
jgi:hypothetical protein